MQVELAPEQHRQQVGGVAWPLGTGGHHVGQAFVMVLMQLARTRMQAGEGLAVRGQHQRVGRQAVEARE